MGRTRVDRVPGDDVACRAVLGPADVGLAGSVDLQVGAIRLAADQLGGSGVAGEGEGDEYERQGAREHRAPSVKGAANDRNRAGGRDLRGPRLGLFLGECARTATRTSGRSTVAKIETNRTLTPAAPLDRSYTVRHTRPGKRARVPRARVRQRLRPLPASAASVAALTSVTAAPVYSRPVRTTPATARAAEAREQNARSTCRPSRDRRVPSPRRFSFGAFLSPAGRGDRRFGLDDYERAERAELARCSCCVPATAARLGEPLTSPASRRRSDIRVDAERARRASRTAPRPRASARASGTRRQPLHRHRPSTRRRRAASRPRRSCSIESPGHNIWSSSGDEGQAYYITRPAPALEVRPPDA